MKNTIMQKTGYRPIDYEVHTSEERNIGRISKKHVNPQCSYHFIFCPTSSYYFVSVPYYVLLFPIVFILFPMIPYYF